MLGPIGTMHIKLSLEKSIYGTVQSKRKARWSTNSETTIKIEAARATQEEIDLRTADFKRLCVVWIEEVSGALRGIVFGRIYLK